MPSQLRLSYREGQGVLRRALAVCTERGFKVAEISTERTPRYQFLPPEPGRDRRQDADVGSRHGDQRPAVVAVVLQLTGTGSVADLAAALSEVDGMLGVSAVDVNEQVE